jgi:hypothetical protein
VQRLEHDHGDHAREEEDDDEGVEDAEPLDVAVRRGLEQVVPARAPLGRVVLLETNAFCL